MITETQWLSLCLASESNQPHEFRYIAYAIRNRVIGRNRFPNTFRDVILQRYQFSYFNPWTGQNVLDDDEIYKVALQGYAGQILERYRDLLEYGSHLMVSPSYQDIEWNAPFSLDVLHYYSPVSMKPKFKPPAWMEHAKYSFTPPGVDPSRFVFAAGVP